MAEHLMNNVLFESGEKHAGPLFIVKTKIRNPSISIHPESGEENGSITYVEYEGKFYGITCGHVVNVLRRENKPISNGEHKFLFVTFTRNNPFIPIQDRFVILPPQLNPANEEIDIALCEIGLAFITPYKITPIKLFSHEPPLFSGIKAAMIIGFPVVLNQFTNGLLSGVHPTKIVVETEPFDESNLSISMHSALDTMPAISNFSGCSGGPIFYTSENRYDLLGIVYQGVKPENSSIFPPNSICFKGELITKSRFKDWIKYYNDHKNDFPKMTSP